MSKCDLLLDSLRRFFDVPEHLEQLIDILGHRKGISLRNLEWFVTNYSKNQQVTDMTPAGSVSLRSMSRTSRAWNGYSKKLFDPFCRTERIEFHGMTMMVAQLNFIRCITNGIIEYMTTQEVLRNRPPPQASRSRSKTGAGSTGSQFEGCMCPGT
jgi:hypothetical protein